MPSLWAPKELSFGSSGQISGCSAVKCGINYQPITHFVCLWVIGALRYRFGRFFPLENSLFLFGESAKSQNDELKKAKMLRPFEVKMQSVFFAGFITTN